MNQTLGSIENIKYKSRKNLFTWKNLLSCAPTRYFSVSNLIEDQFNALKYITINHS